MAQVRNTKVIWGLLVLTLAATGWVSVAQEADAVALNERPRPGVGVRHAADPAAQPTSDEERLALDLTLRLPIVGEPTDLFSIDKPASQQTQEDQAPPAVEVPPLPYTYAGKLVEGEQLIVFLMRGNRNHAVSVGDVVDRVWKLDAIEPARLLFSHIPTRTEVPLLIGERS
jgi:hypothetical protein